MQLQIKKSYVDRCEENTTQQSCRIAFRWIGKGEPQLTECIFQLQGAVDIPVITLVLPIDNPTNSSSTGHSKFLCTLKFTYCCIVVQSIFLHSGISLYNYNDGYTLGSLMCTTTWCIGNYYNKLQFTKELHVNNITCKQSLLHSLHKKVTYFQLQVFPTKLVSGLYL